MKSSIFYQLFICLTTSTITYISFINSAYSLPSSQDGEVAGTIIDHPILKKPVVTNNNLINNNTNNSLYSSIENKKADPNYLTDIEKDVKNLVNVQPLPNPSTIEKDDNPLVNDQPLLNPSNPPAFENNPMSSMLNKPYTKNNDKTLLNFQIVNKLSLSASDSFPSQLELIDSNKSASMSEAKPKCRIEENELLYCENLNSLDELGSSHQNLSAYYFYRCNFSIPRDYVLAYRNARRIQFNRCAINTLLPNNFGQCLHLESLEINENQVAIEFLPGDVQLKSVKRLTISGNRFVNVFPAHFFESFSEVTQLDFSDQDMNSISDEKEDENDVQSFPFSPQNNLMSKLSDLFPHLELFSCDSCNLSRLPTLPISLKKLNLNSNPLIFNQPVTMKTSSSPSEKPIDGNNNPANDHHSENAQNKPSSENQMHLISFENLTNLEELSLVDCQIASFDNNTFRHITGLKILRLGNNRFGPSPDHEWFRPVYGTLRELYLEGNGLTSLDKKLVRWDQLDRVDLSNNSWTCECSFAWINLLDKKVFVGEHPVICHEPKEYDGQKFRTIFSLLSCNGDRSKVAMVIGIPVLLIGLSLVAYYIYKYFSGRRRRGLKNQAIRYNTVYSDTIESNSKQAILS